MTPIELGAMLASYALAAVRLFGLAKPVADLLPKWAQFLIVCLPISLAQFAGLVGVAQTSLDVGAALLSLLVSIGIAYKGSYETPTPVTVTATVTMPGRSPLDTAPDPDHASPTASPAPLNAAPLPATSNAADEDITEAINRGAKS